jgi:signal transduction histidine kinase
MSHALPAAIAFFALGAVVLGTLILLIFDPRSREIRWYSVFNCGIMAWLAVQGWAFATGEFVRLAQVANGTVHILPALFLAFVLVETWKRSDRDALLVIGLGFVTLPFGLGWVLPDLVRLFVVVWHVSMWGTATYGLGLFLRRNERERADIGQPEWLGPAVRRLTLVVAPLVLAGTIAFGFSVFHYAMPLLVVWIQILGFVGVAHLRYYDIEVRAARTGALAAGAAEVERMAVLGELSASLAHEIRNPLTGVRSLAQRLADDDVDEERRRRYAGVILEETGRVERLVSNLLGVARRPVRSPGVVEVTPLRPLIDDLLLLLEARSRRAGVSFVKFEGDERVAANREPLAQLLLNVLLNAIQHSPPAGVVRIDADRDGNEIVVRVRDRGPGIDAERRDLVWEPFHSTSGGTGLGLSVVRRIAKEEGWTVSIDSPPEGGTEFRLSLPAAEAAGPGEHRLAEGVSHAGAAR